jgi:hypothetical protein
VAGAAVTVEPETLLSSCASLALVAGLMLRARHQRKLFRAVAMSPPAVSNAPGVAFILPARHEETNIRSCLEATLYWSMNGVRRSRRFAIRTQVITKSLARSKASIANFISAIPNSISALPK